MRTSLTVFSVDIILIKDYMHAIVYTCNGTVLKALGTDDTISTELSTYKICMSEVMTQNE